MAEGGEVGLEGREVVARERLQVVVVPVEPLSARDQLDTAEEQVEAVRDRRVVRIGVRVERPLAHGIARDEQEVRSVLLDRPRTEPAFVGGRQVGLAYGCASR